MDLGLHRGSNDRRANWRCVAYGALASAVSVELDARFAENVPALREVKSTTIAIARVGLVTAMIAM